MDLAQNFEISDVDGTGGERLAQLWFATRPHVSHEEVHGLIKHMQRLLASCQLQISVNLYAQTPGRHVR